MLVPLLLTMLVGLIASIPLIIFFALMLALSRHMTNKYGGRPLTKEEQEHLQQLCIMNQIIREQREREHRNK